MADIFRTDNIVIRVGDKIEGNKITGIRLDPINGGYVLCTDKSIHHTPEGDFGADWFELVCYHVGK